MEFTDVVRRRRMVRHFSDRPLPADAVERILDNALRAPSAGFTQGWAFLALSDAADRDRFWPYVAHQAEGTPRILPAPLVVVALASKDAYLDRYAEIDKGWEDRDEGRWPVPYWYVDTGMAALLMLLTAVDEGLDACLFGIMPDQISPFRSEFGVPDQYVPIGAVAVGYRADDTPPQTPRVAERRRAHADVVHRGQWGR